MGDPEADEYGTVMLKQLKYKQISYGHVSTASKTRMKIFVVHANNLAVVVGPVIKCVYPVLSFFINFYFSFSSQSKKKEATIWQLSRNFRTIPSHHTVQCDGRIIN